MAERTFGILVVPAMRLLQVTVEVRFVRVCVCGGTGVLAFRSRAEGAGFDFTD